jgi:hypothetical protein
MTLPILAALVLVLLYLWTVHIGLALILILLYLLTCFFQAYCCAYQSCPYIGGFCPAIVGILPASPLAKLLYGGGRIVRSKWLYDLHVVLASLSWLGLVVLPLPWLAKLGLSIAIGYVALHAVYAVIFFLVVCPACAIRRTCPGGRVQSFIRGD